MPQAVCLVIPCFNEARRLRDDAILGFLTSRPHISICLVNDGSDDGTAQLLDAMAARLPSQVLVHHLPRNGGKAAAVRRGMLQASAGGRFAFVGYWDADLSTPLDESERLVSAVQADPRCQMAMASRVKMLGADIDRRAWRHVLGRVFATAVAKMLGMPVYDSQCGAKIFRVEIVPVLFRDPFLTRWSFDVELLARLRDHVGVAGVFDAAAEVPVRTWHEVGGSKLGLAQMTRVPLELFAIWSRYRR
jgi:glycosyltransferase involved in cell wall biosynthesis